MDLFSEAVNNQGWGSAPFSAQNLLTLSQDLGKMKAIKSERWETYSSLLRNARQMHVVLASMHKTGASTRTYNIWKSARN